MSDATNQITSEVPPAPVAYGSPELLREVESFLAYDSELLDEWRLEEWLELFTPDCHYLVPTTDKPDGDPRHDLFFVRDDYFLLSERVAAMLNGTAWTESPHSTTHRMISNVRAREVTEGRVEVKANLLVHRARGAGLDPYPAHLSLLLVRGGRAGFEIVERKAVLAMQQLRPHGRVSILL
jgi:p-cumate 2,3-dioxygenase beta subunit